MTDREPNFLDYGKEDPSPPGWAHPALVKVFSGCLAIPLWALAIVASYGAWHTAMSDKIPSRDRPEDLFRIAAIAVVLLGGALFMTWAAWRTPWRRAPFIHGPNRAD